MGIVEICKYMGWTYEQYLEQPEWFVQSIIIKIREDNRFQRNSQALAKAKHGHF